MWTCSKCGETSEAGFEICWNCGTGRDGTAPAAGFQRQRTEDLETTALNARASGRTSGPAIGRYADGYAAARFMRGTGKVVMAVGVVIGVAIAIAAVAGNAQVGDVADWLIGLLGGLLAGLPVFLIGLLLSGQGRILKATVDTAVNTSPMLSQEEMRKLMALSDVT